MDDIIYDDEGLPCCPNCDCSLSYESAGLFRDTETMGGYAIEYFVCENCCGKFTLIDGSLSCTNGE